MEQVESTEQKTRVKTLDVTMKIFMEYIDNIEKKNGDIKCPACSGTLWGISHSETDPSKPAILTTPLPFSKGRGMWAFPLICSSCGFVITFEASKVVSILEEQGKL